jgi:hypothetical protein
MVEEVKLGDMIDMVGARFEMVARMGITPGDTVRFRTRMAPGKLVPCTVISIPSASMFLRVASRYFLRTMPRNGMWSKPAGVC